MPVKQNTPHTQIITGVSAGLTVQLSYFAREIQSAVAYPATATHTCVALDAGTDYIQCPDNSLFTCVTNQQANKIIVTYV